MTDRDHFNAMLDADPSDQATRDVFADWLMQQPSRDDQILGAGMAWEVEHGKYPEFGYWRHPSNFWTWWGDAEGSYAKGKDDAHILPEAIYTKDSMSFYQSRHIAEVHLANALLAAGLIHVPALEGAAT